MSETERISTRGAEPTLITAFSMSIIGRVRRVVATTFTLFFGWEAFREMLGKHSLLSLR